MNYDLTSLMLVFQNLVVGEKPTCGGLGSGLTYVCFARYRLIVSSGLVVPANPNMSSLTRHHK